MSTLEALILGIIQGLTEFLPISSSGHIELGKALLQVDAKEDITFTVVVHGATVLSTIVVFYKDISQLFAGIIKFQWNESTKYITKIIVSVIPVGIIGLLYKKEIESFFVGNILFVGFMLLITGTLLAFTDFAKKSDKDVSFWKALIIGIAQAVAVLPGISRSGSTIAIGLLLGTKKETITKFSFLMVLIPIIGANVKDMLDGQFSSGDIETIPLLVGFIAAFLSGVIACKWMIKIVKKGKLIYFAIYCSIIGIVAILTAGI